MNRHVFLTTFFLVAPVTTALAQVNTSATISVQTLPQTPEVAREEHNSAVELEGVTVSATRVPTASNEVPASISVITGRELRERGVNDLRTALLLIAGASAAGGGDAGPAGSQPVLRGSSETDDYLLVVDGVPLGGAFNPATAQVDFDNVEKVEVLRGPSPVLYGAISFAGVVSIDHYAAGQADNHVQAFAGTHGGGGAHFAKALPSIGQVQQSLSAQGERLSTSDPSAYADRLHALYRAGAPLVGGNLRLDVDTSFLNQGPASPALFNEMGQQLTRSDANFNPLDAKLTDTHYQLNLVYSRLFNFGDFQATLSATDALAHHRRGALALAVDSADSNPNKTPAEQATEAATEAYNETLAPQLNALAGVPTASGGLMGAGYAQRRHIIDAYSDIHLVNRLGEQLTLTSGIDALFGDAQQRTDSFDYVIGTDGSRPNTAGTPSNSITQLGVTRRYGGLYSQAQWRFLAHSTLTAGLRVNRTEESRRLYSLTVTPPGMDDAFDTTMSNLGLAQGTVTQTSSRDSRSATRVSGLVGLTQRLWHDQDGSDEVVGYGNYRNTFKPADVDFGADASGTILSPQSGQSVELGVKGKGLEKTLSFDADVFVSRVKNVVIKDDATGTLTNAGEEGVTGAELEARYLIAPRFSLFSDYTYTHANYRKLMLGGVDYAGKHLEFIPRHEGALGLLYSKRNGPLASVAIKAVGDRFLDRANQAPLGAYVTVDSALGWNGAHYSVQLAGQNLTNRRVAVGVTEFGEDQYYLLPGRSLRLVFRAPF